MSIATSIDKLSETLTNCKTNLKEKNVENVDNIKISDVDEKIAEIKAGGGNKAIVILTPCGKYVTGTSMNGNDEYTYLNSPRIGQKTGNNDYNAYEINPTYTAKVYIQQENDQKYSKGDINIYEVEPSETEYWLCAGGVHHGEEDSSWYISIDSYKFNEAKVYFLDTSKIEFYDNF